jgi:SagB-type dehydrogenase family enzyme
VSSDWAELEYDARLVSELYHENSKQWRSDPEVLERIVASSVSPMLQQLMGSSGKRYLHARRTPLDAKPAAGRLGPLAEVLAGRRSTRAFVPERLGFEQAGTLLHLSAGIVGSLGGDGHAAPARSNPSAGALYPVELYLCAENVERLERGSYHYDPVASAVELVSAGETGARLAHLSHTAELADAAAVVALTGVPARARVKYGERAYRFLLLEAGHIAQNLLLVATALGLGSLPVGGFVDCELDELLGIDGVDEISLYLIAIGPTG